MVKIVRTAIAASLILALAACDSNNDDPVVVTPTTLSVAGTAIKGVLANATVEIFLVTDLDTVVGTTQTDDEGNYTITITDESGDPIVGAYVVKVIADEDTTMVCDAAVCGDVARGELIPAADLVDLTLSTFTFSDGTGSIDADVNVLTSMSTNAILASAASNENIDLATLDAESVSNLQTSASQVVGSILGQDLSTVNLFNLDIIDGTDFDENTVIAPITNSLSLINASFSGLDSDGPSIVEYLASFEAVVTLLVDPATVGDVTTEDLAVITNTQTQLSTLVEDVLLVVVQDTALQITVEQILTEINVVAIIDTIAAIQTTTGGTGGTGS
jgi:hypothetical protein